MLAERLGQYIITKKISYYSFENSIKASRGSVSKAVKNNKSIGSNVIENILLVYTDLNPVWLLTGKGEMLFANKNSNNFKEASEIGGNLDNFEKIEIIDYVSDNLVEFKSYNSFQKLIKLLFADEEIGEVKEEIKRLKDQVSKMVENSNQ